MNRFFVDSGNVHDGTVVINDPGDVKHIRKVLRMKIGDTVEISDRVQWEYVCEIIYSGDDEIEAKILDKQRFAREPDVEITLFQGIPKQGKMDFIVQKAVELGVKTVVPVFMSRTVVSDNGKYGKKIERYRTIAQEAAKQSKRGIVPDVTDHMTFSRMAECLGEYDLVVFPYENEDERTIKNLLTELDEIPVSVAVIIGPEGGFADSEAEMLKEMGIVPVSLGKNILRTETAGLAAAAMIMYQLEL